MEALQTKEVNHKDIKIIALGGVEEIGINCTIFEYQDQILVVDIGLGFPDNNMYGVDYIVPNIDYLKQNIDKIVGVVITHGHLDHIGGLPFLLPEIGFPKVYGTQFTLELIKSSLIDHKLDQKVSLNVFTPEDKLKFGPFSLEFFRVNHSIPQAVGVVINTPAARIVHTGDFKFDNSPVNEPVADYARIAKIGEEGVDLLLSDSTNSMRKGHPISEADVAIKLEDTIEHAQGRVIIASFSGLVGRLYQLIQIAQKHGRKVAIAGFSMNKTLRIAQEIGYIKPKPGTIVPIQRINRFNDRNVMILTTGSQGEEEAALYKMATAGYRNVHLKKGDKVIISAGTIPGNNAAVQALIDEITRCEAAIHQTEDMNFFTSGHGYQEDQKIMLNLTKPTWFMPVHGYQYFLREHGNTAVQVGVQEKNIIIAERGMVIQGNKHDGFRKLHKVKNNPLLVSGSGVGDIGASVLAERTQLGNHGVVVINLQIHRQQKRVLGEPFIYTKGFVYVKSSSDILQEIKQIALRAVTKKLTGRINIAEIQQNIEAKVSQFVQKEISRQPVIVSIINLVGTENGNRSPLRKPVRPAVAPVEAQSEATATAPVEELAII